MKFTLVSTVFNEASRLEKTISDLEAQTLQPSEIIITDAGSLDGTFSMLQEWQARSAIPIILLQKERCNVAAGRNMAIKATTYPLIASMDFGCRFHPQWLETLMAPFSDPTVKVVGGASTVKEEDIETLSAKAAYLLFNGYTDNVHDPYFTPNSRSIAYYKEVFDTVGGYCEWLTLAADDTVFGRLIKKKGYSFFMVDKPYVYWGRHKTRLAYENEAFRYGLGNGEARINIRNTVGGVIQMSFRFVLTAMLLILTALVIIKDICPLWLLLVLPFVSGFRPYIFHTRIWRKFYSAKYNFGVYLYSLYMLETTRLHFYKGFYKGYFKSPVFRKTEAKKLEKLFA